MPSAIQSTAVTQFEQFSRFAADALMKGDKTAVARLDGAPGTSQVIHVTVTTEDKVRMLRRSQDNKNANDATRALFKQTVIDMFGSESRVPASVWKAMNLKDFDAGKPLTARRIAMVKSAVQTEMNKLRHANMWLKDVLPHTGKTLSNDQYTQAKGIIAKYGNTFWKADQNVRRHVIERLIDLVADPQLGKHADDLFALIPWNLEELRTFTLEDLREQTPDKFLS